MPRRVAVALFCSAPSLSEPDPRAHGTVAGQESSVHRDVEAREAHHPGQAQPPRVLPHPPTARRPSTATPPSRAGSHSPRRFRTRQALRLPSRCRSSSHPPSSPLPLPLHNPPSSPHSQKNRPASPCPSPQLSPRCDRPTSSTCPTPAPERAPIGQLHPGLSSCFLLAVSDPPSSRWSHVRPAVTTEALAEQEGRPGPPPRGSRPQQLAGR